MKSFLLQRLDRPRLRPVLALLLRLRIRQVYGVWVPIRYREGIWFYRWPDAVVPVLDPIRSSPSDIERSGEDIFFQEYRPKEGDVIVDLGAGVGTEIGLMSRVVGASGRVLAVEADPVAYTCLRLRIEMNGITNVIPVHAAVIEREGAVSINTAGHHLRHHVLDEGEGERVSATTVDRLASAYELEHIDLLKVNIEGAEARALEGMHESIGLVKNVAVSCHDFLGFETKAAVEQFLSASGFTVRQRRSDDLRDWAQSWVYGTRTESAMAVGGGSGSLAHQPTAGE